MNYIYDVALNFQENYYQFFEWNRHDKIKNIAKIPLYHISDEDILSFNEDTLLMDVAVIYKDRATVIKLKAKADNLNKNGENNHS